MPSVRFDGRVFEIDGNETVLECLERNGISRPASCRNGHCQVCTITCRQGQLPANSQVGLSPAQVQLGTFLPCICRPSGDISIEDSGSVIYSTKLIEHVTLAPNIAVLRLQRPSGMQLLPGQFIHVHKEPGTLRSYSVANRAVQDSHIEIHIRRIPGGQVSPWLVDELRAGDDVTISGPYGTCVYTEDANYQPLVLAGTSTGLAPLLGILREALAQGHRGSIDLYHGAATLQGLYLRDELKALAQSHHRLNIHWSALDADNAQDLVSNAPISKLIQENHANPESLRVYLCGAPDFVKKLKRSLFLSGTPFQQIFSDPFTG